MKKSIYTALSILSSLLVIWFSCNMDPPGLYIAYTVITMGAFIIARPDFDKGRDVESIAES